MHKDTINHWLSYFQEPSNLCAVVFPPKTPEKEKEEPPEFQQVPVSEKNI